MSPLKSRSLARGKSEAASWLLAILFSVAAGLFGSAFSKGIVLDPQINRLGLEGVSRDGWMEAEAAINLTSFSEAIRAIDLSFDAWRPRGQAPAQVSFLACGKALDAVAIRPTQSEVHLAIPSDCTDRLEIKTKNGFRSADGRVLSVQLRHAQLRSDLAHAVQLDEIALWAAGILLFLFATLIFLELPFSQLLVAFIVLSALTAYAMSYLAWDNQFQLLSLGVVLIVFVLGLNPRFQPRYALETTSAKTQGGVWIVLAVCFVGALLRFYDTSFGLPQHYHPDEPRKAQIVLRMLQSGSLDPNYFLHPSLLLYLTAVYAKIGYLLGFFPDLSISNVTWSGRLVSASAGAASLLFIYPLGRDLISKRTGMIALLAFAFCPLHVTCSRYFKEDALVTFFVILTSWLAVRAVKRDEPRLLLLAAFCAGLASSSKYSGAVTCVAVAMTPWLRSRSIVPDLRFLKWGVASALLVPVGFVAATPYSILNFQKFSNHFAAEQEHMISGHHKVIISAWSQYWMYHMSRSLPDAATLSLSILGIFGFGWLLRSSPSRAIFLLGMFLAFYLPAEAVNAKPPPQPERYILPCLPFLYLAAASLVEGLRQSHHRLIAGLLSFVIVLSPLVRSLILASELKPDTRERMRDWIVQNIPPGSKIVVDAQAYSAFLPGATFNVQPMWSIPQRRGMTLEQLRSDKVDYLLLTNKSYERYFLTRSADQIIRSRFEDVFNNWLLVKEIKSPFGSYGFSNPELKLYKVEKRG